MKLKISIVTAMALFGSSASHAASDDIMTIYLDTTSADDVSIVINMSDQNANPDFETLENVSIIRPSQIDVFGSSDVNVTNSSGSIFYSWTDAPGTDPDQLHSPHITFTKAFASPDFGDLYFSFNMSARTYTNFSGQNMGPFSWANESDWPIRFSSGGSILFNRFEVGPALVPIPASIFMLGPVLAAFAYVRHSHR